MPSKNSYLKCMINKLENFVRRFRWKAYFFENKIPESNEGTKSKYGFKSDKSPPQNKYLVEFENDLYAMVRSI